MKKLLFLLPLLALGLVAVGGCPDRPAAPPKENVTKGQAKPDSTKNGLELLRTAQSADRYREALRLVNNGLGQTPGFRDKITLDARGRKFLEKTVGFSGDELQEAESPTFRPADAYHVAESFFFRDVHRTLETKELPAAQQAELCFRWVMQHVLLHEQGDENLPPAFILRRGYGSARDRAVVFLTLMRQFQMEGAVLVLPPAPEDVVLVGVIEPKSDTIRLFDPRLGMPVQTAAGKVASLQEVQGDAKLLAPSEITAEQFKSAEWRLVCPLYSLPLRMRELERALAGYDRITLYCDAVKLKDDLSRLTKMPVSIWSGPVRALRNSLSPDEGGTDKTARLKRLQADRLPVGSMVLALKQIKLGPEQLVNPALQHLMLGVIGGLVDKYDTWPAEMSLRGKEEEVIKRLERIQVFLDAYNLENLNDDADAHKEISQWRALAANAYEALALKDPRAQSLVNQLWGEDQYLTALLQVDMEDLPEKYAKNKKVLTRIVAHAIRDYLDLRSRWLRAQLWQDKAERDQAIADRAGADNKAAAGNAKSAWFNAKVNWQIYLDKGGLGPTGRARRLEMIEVLLKSPAEERGPTHALRQIMAMHVELHQYFAASINRARALHYEGNEAAIGVLQTLDNDLGDLLEKKGPGGEPELKSEVSKVLAALQGPERDMSASSVELLQRDWAPQGNVYWLKRHVRRQIELWDKGP